MKKFYFLLIAMMVGFVANAATMYFENTKGWDLYMYTWTDGNNNGKWPGVKLTETTEIDGTTYYVAESNFKMVIFSNNGDDKAGGNDLQVVDKGIYNCEAGFTGNTIDGGSVVIDTEVFLAGKFNSYTSDDANYKFTSTGNGNYTFTWPEATFTSDFKVIVSGSWLGTTTPVVSGESYVLSDIGMSNSKLAVESAKNVVFNYNVDSKTLVVTYTTDGGDDPEPPVPSKNLYGIHGTVFNGSEWQTVNFTNEDGVLTLTAAFVPGVFGVKVMDENGDQLDGAAGWLASPTGETVSAAGTYALGSGSNFTSTIEGQYKVTFDPTAMTLTFAEDDTPIEHVITYALRGTVVTGEWDDYSMTEVAEGWYVTLSVTAGDESVFGIKKMDNGVQTNWYAAPEATTIAEAGSYKATGLGGTNWVCGLDGTYTFVFDPETETLKVWKGTLGVENVAADNAPVEYYNLQGVRVNNPENGIFIRRQGNNVTKVIR